MHLQAFLRYLATLGVEWTDVTDNVLIAWRDALGRDRGLKPATVAHYLGTVFVSHRISHIMRSVGIENAAGHRLRASALTDPRTSRS